jgi:hypothetical protein
VKPLKHPESSVKLQVVARRQFPAPRIVNDHGRTKLRGLHNCLNLAAILRALPSSLCEEEIDCALLVAIATLEKRVGVKEKIAGGFS